MCMMLGMSEKSRKAKKSDTQSTEFVEKQGARRGQGKKAVDKAVTKYYDSLTAEDMEEQARWAEFALGEV